jgi:hypothetical protein
VNEAELRELCALWQKRLRLQDWNVSLEIVNARDLDGGFANCRTVLREKAALIRVTDPADSTSADTEIFGGRDVEEDLVHELLHLSCEPFSPEDRDSTEYEAIEQMVGVLANCIVRIVRENAWAPETHH